MYKSISLEDYIMVKTIFHSDLPPALPHPASGTKTDLLDQLQVLALIPCFVFVTLIANGRAFV